MQPNGKQVFLQYEIINCPSNRPVSQDICTPFARYLYTTLLDNNVRLFGEMSRKT